MLGRTAKDYTEQDIAELLERHAEAMLHGRDMTEKMSRTHGRKYPMLDGLLRLAQRLYMTLVPVEPSERFVEKLRTRLEKMQMRRMRSAARWDKWQGRTGQLSRVLGSALSVLAIVAVVIQVLGSIGVVIMIILGNRRRTTATA